MSKKSNKKFPFNRKQLYIFVKAEINQEFLKLI